MPHSSQKTHQNFSDKAIRNIDLSGCFYTKIINTKNHISHFEIARRFRLNPLTVRDALADFAAQDGQGDTVHREGFLLWADATAFHALVIELRVHQALTSAVLASLTALEQVAA
jgi:hypothetical protein